jgi:hypothetical protein
MKRDRGIGNYSVRPDATTLSADWVARRTSPALISWPEFSDLLGNADGLPDPATLGLLAG